MGGSHITLTTRGNTARISRERIDDLMTSEDGQCIFSARAKFTDFCRRIFSGKSKIGDYKHIHQLLCYDNPKSLWDETIESHWRPLLGLMKMMDHSRAEHRQHYRIAWQNNGFEVNTLTLMYAGKPITRPIFNQQETEFLKKRLFNEHNGEIILSVARTGTDKERYASAFLHHYQRFKQYRAKSAPETAPAARSSASVAAASSAFPTQTARALSAGDDNHIAAIDRFLGQIKGKSINQHVIAKGKEIGRGSYGSAYKIGPFVVNIPRNKDKVWIDFAALPNAHPVRTQYYLNRANDEPDFARAGVMTNKHGDSVDVLVTRFIAGSTLEDLFDEVERDALRTKALLQLNARGLFMHDADVIGNILVDEGGRIYFIDADQMVIAHHQRLTRAPSFATEELEEVLEIYYQAMAKRALKRGKRNNDYLRRLSALRARPTAIGITAAGSGP